MTATDIPSNTSSSGVPNYRDDAVAFGLNITSTGDDNTGSVWIEYNIEFASPRQPEPVVNTSVFAFGNVPSGSNAGLAGHNGLTSPVANGNVFYAALTAGQPTLQSGYTQVATGTTEGVSWRQIRRDSDNPVWAALTGASNQMVGVLASASLTALTRAFKNLEILTNNE